MPTYEYECLKCGHHFDASQSMNDKPLEICPKCRGKVKRLISSGAGFIFKGSGFYATDYRKKDSGKGSSVKSREAREAGAGCNGCPKSHTCNP